MIYLIILIASFLRIFHLGFTDLWFDEAISVARAWGKFSALDPQPPLYFILLRFWMQSFGYNEFSVRLFSALASIIAVFFIYKIGELLFNKQTGIISALILSLSPFHIWYAQEARPFSLFSLLTLLSTWFFILALRTDKRQYWIGTCLFLVINSYVSYWSFFLIPALSTPFFYKQYKSIFKKWLLCVSVSMLCFMPWGYSFLKQTTFVDRGFWVPKPVMKQLVITAENFNLGYNATDSLYLLSWAVFGVLFIIGVISLTRKKDVSFFIVVALFFPVITTFIISQKIPVYLDRHLIGFSMFYYLIISYGWQRLRVFLKSLWVVSYVILVALPLFFYYTYPEHVPSFYAHHFGVHAKKPLKPAVEFLIEYSTKDDFLVFAGPNIGPSLWYYINYYYRAGTMFIPEKQWYGLILPLCQDEYFRRIYSDYSLRIINKPEALDSTNNLKRIWLISSAWEIDYTLDDNSSTAIELLNKNYKRTFERWFDGILIGLYEEKK